MNYLQLGPTECWPFKGPRDEAPNVNSKMACRNPQCCNPRHVVAEETTINEVIANKEQTEAEINKSLYDGLNSIAENSTPKRRGRPPKVK